jgi:hypothetical protein
LWNNFVNFFNLAEFDFRSGAMLLVSGADEPNGDADRVVLGPMDEVRVQEGRQA